MKSISRYINPILTQPILMFLCLIFQLILSSAQPTPTFKSQLSLLIRESHKNQPQTSSLMDKETLLHQLQQMFDLYQTYRPLKEDENLITPFAPANLEPRGSQWALKLHPDTLLDASKILTIVRDTGQLNTLTQLSVIQATRIRIAGIPHNPSASGQLIQRLLLLANPKVLDLEEGVFTAFNAKPISFYFTDEQKACLSSKDPVALNVIDHGAWIINLLDAVYTIVPVISLAITSYNLVPSTSLAATNAERVTWQVFARLAWCDNYTLVLVCDMSPEPLQYCLSSPKSCRSLTLCKYDRAGKIEGHLFRSPALRKVVVDFLANRLTTELIIDYDILRIFAPNKKDGYSLQTLLNLTILYEPYFQSASVERVVHWMDTQSRGCDWALALLGCCAGCSQDPVLVVSSVQIIYDAIWENKVITTESSNTPNTISMKHLLATMKIVLKYMKITTLSPINPITIIQIDTEPTSLELMQAFNKINALCNCINGLQNRPYQPLPDQSNTNPTLISQYQLDIYITPTPYLTEKIANPFKNILTSESAGSIRSLVVKHTLTIQFQDEEFPLLTLLAKLSDAAVVDFVDLPDPASRQKPLPPPDSPCHVHAARICFNIGCHPRAVEYILTQCVFANSNTRIYTGPSRYPELLAILTKCAPSGYPFQNLLYINALTHAYSPLLTQTAVLGQKEVMSFKLYVDDGPFPSALNDKEFFAGLAVLNTLPTDFSSPDQYNYVQDIRACLTQYTTMPALKLGYYCHQGMAKECQNYFSSTQPADSPPGPVLTQMRAWDIILQPWNTPIEALDSSLAKQLQEQASPAQALNPAQTHYHLKTPIIHYLLKDHYIKTIIDWCAIRMPNIAQINIYNPPLDIKKSEALKWKLPNNYTILIVDNHLAINAIGLNIHIDDNNPQKSRIGITNYSYPTKIKLDGTQASRFVFSISYNLYLYIRSGHTCANLINPCHMSILISLLARRIDLCKWTCNSCNAANNDLFPPTPFDPNVSHVLIMDKDIRICCQCTINQDMINDFAADKIPIYKLYQALPIQSTNTYAGTSTTPPVTNYSNCPEPILIQPVDLSDYILTQYHSQRTKTQDCFYKLPGNLATWKSSHTLPSPIPFDTTIFTQFQPQPNTNSDSKPKLGTWPEILSPSYIQLAQQLTHPKPIQSKSH
ncbi:hypothetical protein NEHOM01_0428 [Nematocida homosporus]|uniref:uncharacterized protein n=1 Tax=Nematocida homosporus TaxID=1912981 RepID=UPI00221FC29D|nr:uncharacterized protein NEHOM01_0428 [Nematocida homosporus]KAI5184826.1 hypothetical protein NEHOM01_0428 [Nematocida homosporus]